MLVHFLRHQQKGSSWCFHIDKIFLLWKLWQPSCPSLAAYFRKGNPKMNKHLGIETDSECQTIEIQTWLTPLLLEECRMKTKETLAPGQHPTKYCHGMWSDQSLHNSLSHFHSQDMIRRMMNYLWMKELTKLAIILVPFD